MARKDKPKGMKAMGNEYRTFLFLFVFFLFMTPIYVYFTHGKELAGSFALALTGVLFLLITLYLGAIARKMDLRPEDNPDGEIYQGAGELGFFPPQSIWPFWCALTLTIILVGVVFGWWISIMGIGMGIWSVSGWVYEFYRGRYAH